MKEKEYDVIILSGGFDPVHVGHVRMFEAASKLSINVVVGLNSDEWLARKKGKPFMPFDERKEIIEAFECVHSVISFKDDDDTACDLIDKEMKLSWDGCRAAFANGGDRTSDNTPEMKTCAELKVIMLWGIGGDKIQSSSDLVKNSQ